MIRSLDLALRTTISWPIVLLGYALTALAEGLIWIGAWIADIPIEDC